MRKNKYTFDEQDMLVQKGMCGIVSRIKEFEQEQEDELIEKLKKRCYAYGYKKKDERFVEAVGRKLLKIIKEGKEKK